MKLPALFLLVAGLSCATAQSRTSSHYAIASDTLGEAGGASAAGSYGNHGAAGEVTSTGASGGSATGKAGAVAQLTEPKGLLLQAAPPEVPEDGSLTILPFFVLDDTSLIAISPGQLAWSIVSGPVLVSPEGVATGQAVAADTMATLVATGAAFTATLDLTVKNILPDNYGSYAGDGLADDWQVFHFGQDNPLASPEVDADGDGQDNRFEFTAGLFPTDAASRFRSHIESVPGEPDQKRVVFSPVFPDRTYTLLGSLALDGAQAWLPVEPVATSTAGEERSVTDLDAMEPSMFYRVEIQRP